MLKEWSIELVRIVKANAEFRSDYIYYVTLKAKDKNQNKVKTYQLSFMVGLGDKIRKVYHFGEKTAVASSGK